MPTELRDLLTRAAPTEIGEPDVEAAWTHGRHARRLRRAAALMTVVCAVALVAVGFAVVRSGDTAPHVATSPTTGTRYTSPASTPGGTGWELTTPPGWTLQHDPLTPYVGDPRELFSAATFPISDTGAGPACDAQLPKGVLDAMGPGDIYVLAAEAHFSGQVSNPQAAIDPNAFPPRPSSFAGAPFQTIECSGPTWSYPDLSFERLAYTDDGHVIIVLAALGNAVSDARQGQLNALLDSFHIQDIPAPPTYRPGTSTTISSPLVRPSAAPILFTRGGAIWIAVPSSIPVGTGEGLRALTPPCSCGAAVWSPDRRQIAFLQAGVLSVMDADGSDVRSLGQRSIFHPTWSPDGTRIAFSAGAANGGPIQVVSVDGGEVRTVADVFAGAPSWSPDGNTILYTDLHEPVHISRVEVSTGAISPAVTGPGVDGEQAWPAYSPDGRLVALTDGGVTEPTGIFVTQPDGDGLRRVTTGNDTEPAWSPDGTQIVFARATGNAQQLLVVNVATGAVRPLFAQDADSSLPAW